MNMPLFVTEYLKEREGYVGTLEFMCWLRGAFYGYIRDFSIQIIYTHFAYTRSHGGGLFILVLVYLKIYI